MTSKLQALQNKLTDTNQVMAKADQAKVKGGAGATEYIILLVLIA